MLPRTGGLSMLLKDRHISSISAYLLPSGRSRQSASGSKMSLSVLRTVSRDHAERRRLWRRLFRGSSRWRGAGWRATRRLCRGGTELSPKPGDPEGNLLLAEKEIAAALVLEPSLRYVVFPSSSPARTRPWSPSTMMRKTPNVARAPGSSQASPGSLGSTSPTVFPKEFLARP